MSMKVTLLGTCSGVPSITRNVSSACIQLANTGESWMIDCGEGTQRQIFSPLSSIKLGSIRRILITHLHGDHIYGLPGLLCTLSSTIDSSNPDAPPTSSSSSSSSSSSTSTVVTDEKKDTLMRENVSIASNFSSTSTSSTSGFQTAGPPLMIVGPQGIRSYIRASLRLSYACPIYPMIIHELHLPNNKYKSKEEMEEEAIEKEREMKGETVPHFDPSTFPLVDPLPNEIGGLNLQLNNGVWEIPSMNESLNTIGNGSGSGSGNLNDSTIYELKACPIKHTVPCVGYIIQEKNLVGKLNMQRVQPHLERNKPLLAQQGITNPMTLLAKIKKGEDIVLPDGTIIKPSDALDPPKVGRKLVYLGDTCDSSGIAAQVQGCDLLVHESTNARLSTDNRTDEQVESMTKDHGHSTPQMAGRFASMIQAKSLLLTHFSQRYAYKDTPESKAMMDEIVSLAAKEYSGPILAGYDFFSYELKPSK